MTGNNREIRRVHRVGIFESVILPDAGLPDKTSYTIGEVARMLGISPPTLRKRLYDGTYSLYYFIPPNASSRTLRIYKSDLVKFFESSWCGGVQ